MTLQGSTKDFPLEAVIGLLATASKTGELQIRSADQVGALGFASGRLVAAVCGDHGGEDALGAIFSIREATFEFTPWTEAPEGNLEGDLDSLLRRAAESRDRLASIRAVIPDDRMRFRLSERAADQGAVTFTPERWRALLAVNGDRDVSAIAQQLGIGRMDALNLLAGLLRDGVIEALAAPAEAAPPATFAPPPTVAAPATFAAPAPPPQAASPETATQAPPPAPDWMTSPGGAAPEWRPPAPTGEWTAPARAAPAPVEPAPAAHAWSEAPAAAEPEPPPAPQWADPAAPPEWTKPSSEWAPTAPEAPAAPAASTVTDWSASTPPAPPEQDGRTETADLGESMDDEMKAAPPPADDRLAAIFAPPSEQTPPPAPAASWSAPASDLDSWSASTSASTSAPAESASGSASTWGDAAQDTPASANQWAPDAPSVAVPPALSGEWAPPASAPEAPAEKKKGGLFGMFAREKTTAVPAAAQEPIAGSTRLGALAAFSNALIAEFNSGKYGKARIEERMANLLMRVDEQADPIDRPLPIVDDRIDVEALERESLDDAQAAPYLASIARQIFEDAEKAFGKDKAKKGYKVAQQRIFLGDISVLHAPDIAGKLPKV